MSAASSYAEGLVPRFHALLRRVVPPDAEVLVVSKGDRLLVAVEGCRTAHFPQRADGVYSGYYPPDSAAAIAHLESLRARGAAFLAFPATSLWWLEHYAGLREHLSTHGRLVEREEEIGAVFALDASPRSTEADDGPARSWGSGRDGVEIGSDGELGSMRRLFDAGYYSAQAGTEHESDDAALRHYLDEGHRRGLSPHPLFDVEWYVERYPDAAGPMSPLLHFIRHGVERELDPNPYFDTAYYYAQAPGLRASGQHALAHYLEHAARNASHHPNPLFRDGFYLRTYRDARELGTPLEHYLRVGWHEGRSISNVHQDIARHLQRASRSALTRGGWRVGTALLLCESGEGAPAEAIARIAARLADHYHVDPLLVVARRGRDMVPAPASARAIVLEDYQLACDILRPAARRLLIKTLTALEPMLAVSDVTDGLEVLRRDGVGTLFVLGEAGELPSRRSLEEAFDRAHRVVVPSSAAYRAAADRLGRHPVNVALRAPGADDYPDSVVQMAARDFGLPAGLGARDDPVAAEPPTRRIVIPCSDWGVSGVNASLEAAGEQLQRLGWDVEILFTREEAWVRGSAQGDEHMPTLPHRYLRLTKPGIEGLWEALIADLERAAPCVVFTSYDFLANAVIPALTERVGVAMWLQADDGDYYEQAYRLGRYCDAVVCVSGAIKEKVGELNPALAAAAHVVHNSSVREQDVAGRRAPRSKTLRIAYAGRLVQYQKRVLDFVELARGLDATGVPYEISLIGSFPKVGETEQQFHAAAAEHVESGRIRLLGRLTRAEILSELDRHDFFALLSDFEGLPLSLVEAMARGCVPVVAAMDSGIPEVVRDGDNGLVVDGRDYEAWARRIVASFHDRRALARMSRRARADVRRRFTVERTAGQLSDVLASVASATAAPAPRRPAALHWGLDRSWTGDVLPPPSIFRPAAVRVRGLR